MRHANLYIESDGTASFERWAIMPTLRALVRLGGPLYAVTSGGLQYESRIRLRGEGLLQGLDAKFDPAVGGLLEEGLLYISEERFGLDISFRYTIMNYTYQSTSVNGNGAGLFIAAQYFL